MRLTVRVSKWTWSIGRYINGDGACDQTFGRHQLRRMEGELESQIIARHGGENSRYADFDPLEMDQYSSLKSVVKISCGIRVGLG